MGTGALGAMGRGATAHGKKSNRRGLSRTHEQSQIWHTSVSALHHSLPNDRGPHRERTALGQRVQTAAAGTAAEAGAVDTLQHAAVGTAGARTAAAAEAGVVDTLQHAAAGPVGARIAPPAAEAGAVQHAAVGVLAAGVIAVIACCNRLARARACRFGGRS